MSIESLLLLDPGMQDPGRLVSRPASSDKDNPVRAAMFGERRW
jgi:hypothetical protein